MNIKRIGIIMLMVAVVGAGTTAIYANKKSDDSTKNVVVAVQKQKVTKNVETPKVNKTITDEDAVKMATKAMKDYMGLDANYFSKTSVTRDKENENGKITDKEKQQLIKMQNNMIKAHPELASKAKENLDKAIKLASNSHETINVDFTLANGASGTDFVSIDAVTGKIINVTAINGLPTYFKGTVDEAKVKEAAINFMKKIGRDSEFDSSKITVNNDGSLDSITIQLKDQTTVMLEVSLQNYTVMHYDNEDEIYSK